MHPESSKKSLKSLEFDLTVPLDEEEVEEAGPVFNKVSPVQHLKQLKHIVLLGGPWLLAMPLLRSYGHETRCAGCLIIMAAYWITEVIPLPVTALLPMILFPILGILPSTAVAKAFINEVTFLFIGGLVVAIAVEKCGLHERIAFAVLSLVGSSPKWIMLGFMVVTAILSAFVSNAATTAMMIPVSQAVITQLFKCYRLRDKVMGVNHELLNEADEKKQMLPSEKRMAKGLVMCICFAANIGGIGTITGTTPNMVLIGQLGTLYPAVDTGINYITWMIFCFPLMMICLLISWVVLYFLFLHNGPPAADEVTEYVKSRYAALPGISFAESSVAACFTLLLTLWILPQVAPSLFSGLEHESFTDATSAVIVAILLFMLPANMPSISEFFKKEAKKPKKNYARLLDWPTMEREFPWGVLLLLCGGFALAAGVKESGLSEYLGRKMAHIAEMPLTAVQAICMCMTIIVTNICSNTVTVSIFLPVLATLAEEAQLHPIELMLPMTLTCSFAFMLPVATAPNAIAFDSGMFTVYDMIVAGFFVTITTCTTVAAYMSCFGDLVFGLHPEDFWNATNIDNIGTLQASVN
uniref:CitMHS domain-containing protein n=1 Tax=Panagrellus redivivus TaxID=6233 RepID=A0A7E4W1W5_PANRE